MTTNREIRILADANNIAQTAAAEFLDAARDAVREKDSFTVALAGGSALRTLWQRFDQRKLETAYRSEPDVVPRRQDRLKPWQKTFICNALASFAAISLLQRRRRSMHTRSTYIPMTIPISRTQNAERGRMSATLDLTLLVLVRAVDALVQGLVFRRTGDEKKQERKRRLAIISKLDALAFWASSAGSASLTILVHELPLIDLNCRIMWCFFYEPKRCVLYALRMFGAND